MKLDKGYLFHNRYILIATLGSGASADVWKAKDTKANNLLVALKIFSQHSDMDSYGLQNFEKEFTTVYNMRHSNLLPPTGYDLCEGRPYLVMQYCENGSCSSMIGRMEEEDIIKFLHDVSAGLEYLHDHNIIHQDIKPDNILLDDNCNFMVTDFGISVSMDKGIYDSNGMSGGTRAYMGPERFEGITNNASDMWSLGATAVEMLTGNPPYGEHGGLLQAEGEPLPELPALQPEVKNMILSCLEKDPVRRIKANEIRQKIELYWETGSWVKPSRKRMIATMATVVASVFMCLGIFLWDYNRTKVYYYKDYTERWGIPEGIGRISSGQAKRMNRMYRFECTQGKVRNVSHVNSFGKIISDNESERNERPFNQDIYYADGKVNRIKVMDNNDKVLYMKVFSEDLHTMVFQYEDNTERALSSRSVGYGRILDDESVEKGRISRWWIDYNQEGFVSKIRYAGIDNKAVGDDNNIYGRTMLYDAKGRISEIHYIGKDGEPKSTKWGLGIKKFQYDKKGNWIRAEYYTIDNKPAYDDKDGTSIYEITYDENDNPLESYHKDGDGSLMAPKKNNIAGCKYEYDEHGCITKTIYLDTNMDPTIIGSIGSGYVCKYDQNGFMTEQIFVDPDGNPYKTSEGNCKRTYTYDEKGNLLENWAYDLNGNLCVTFSDGVAGTSFEYDSLGNCLEIVYYGIDRKPYLNKNGEAGVRYKYNERNQSVEYLTLGTDLLPTYGNNHICMIRYEYDQRGNMVKIMFYNENGQNLVDSNEKVAGWNIKYDDFGKEIERTFFNAQNQTCEVIGGYAKKTYEYDDYGHLRSERYYNLSGKLTAIDGIAGYDYQCDDRGNLIVNRPIGADGNTAANYLEERFKYDAFDNCIEKSFFDDGQAAQNLNGIHKITAKFNSRNQEIETRYYSKYGALTLAANLGVAIIKNEYDKKGYKVQTFYYGIDEKLIKGKEGWASSSYEYDSYGNVVKQSFFDIDGKPSNPKDMVPVSIYKYDRYNNMVYLASQDGHGNFIINPQFGWAIQKMEYDNKSQMLWCAFFDENEKPINCKDGYHKQIREYNSNGNVTKITYHDADLKPMEINGFHEERNIYNEKGKHIVMSLHDKYGKPTNCDAGYHKYEITYDDSNVPIRKKYYASNGKLLIIQNYNKQTGLWSDPQSITGDQMVGWQEVVRKDAQNCPIKMEEGIYAQSIKYTNSSVILTVKMHGVSKYDAGDFLSNLAENGESIKKELRKGWNLPDYISLKIIFIDKADRELCTI